jgi:hypothetical protein
MPLADAQITAIASFDDFSAVFHGVLRHLFNENVNEQL